MKKLVVLDIECYPNYFLIALKGLESQKLITFECYGEGSHLTKDERKRLRNVMSAYTTFGFNSNNYDLPMLTYALSGASCSELYVTSKSIIEDRMQSWMVYRKLGLDAPTFDHFDVSEPSPAVMISLKNYGTRVGSKKLWDLPFDPHHPVTRDEADTLRDYCENDLDVTIDLYNAIADRIELRVSMGEQYGLDLRSKSDAQIAEAVITSELQKVGVIAKKPELPSDYKAHYTAPEFIHFETADLKELVEMIEGINFGLQANGSVKMPKELASKKIVIGSTTYKMGIGGLHSQEKSLSVVNTETQVMRNADFHSYYPAMIIGLEFFPKHLSEKFLGVYGKIRDERLFAKSKVKELEKELKDVLSQTG